MKIFLKKLAVAGLGVMLCLLHANHVAAQLTITNSAQFIVSGNAQLTLANIDFNNNGNFIAGSGIVSFTGNTPTFIEGGQTSRFYNLQLNKAVGVKVTMLQPVTVSQQINFTSGLLDLNGFDADLGTTGLLNGEQESSHMIGANGGNIIFTATLNAPSSANPGNLGMLITSSQNLGNTIIRRGHQSQTNIFGAGNSVLRYYDIAPANNTGLNATLRFPFLNAELNGFDENSLVFWEKQPAPEWNAIGFDNRNTATNYIEKNAISVLGRFTLSSANNALPVRFILFNTHCNGSAVLLTWKTAQEQNAHHYTVQRSVDAIQWTALGNIPAAGNSNAENDYSYVDNTAAANNYYRIAEYDIDGRSQLTKILKADCSNRNVFSIWPNPVVDILYINISAETNSNAVVKIFDGKGALVKQQAAKLLQGNNLLSVDVKGVAGGLYFTAISYGNGKLQTQKIIKQ